MRERVPSQAQASRVEGEAGRKWKNVAKCWTSPDDERRQREAKRGALQLDVSHLKRLHSLPEAGPDVVCLRADLESDIDDGGASPRRPDRRRCESVSGAVCIVRAILTSQPEVGECGCLQVICIMCSLLVIAVDLCRRCDAGVVLQLEQRQGLEVVEGALYTRESALKCRLC